MKMILKRARRDQATFFDRLMAELHERGRALHASELENFLGAELQGKTILSLAPADARFRVSTGQYLYLADWGTPRRESISEAILKILAAAPDPLSFDDIVRRVEGSIGRACDRTAVSGALQAIDATVDQAGCWSLQASALEVDSVERVHGMT